MTKYGLLFLGALLGTTSLLVAAGCGDEGSGGSGGSGNAGGTGGMGAEVDCNAYCTDIMANCTGTNKQYADMASCMGVCAKLPADGMAGAASGNTMQCRVYHTSAAKSGPDMHCAHAGPSGGGACGTLCESFCSIATDACATEWPDAAACATDCMGWTSAGMPYNTSFTSMNTTECRLYHLSVAATGAAAATTHCPHTTAMSTTCM